MRPILWGRAPEKSHICCTEMQALYVLQILAAVMALCSHAVYRASEEYYLIIY